jgi:hypothetical protein
MCHQARHFLQFCTSLRVHHYDCPPHALFCPPSPPPPPPPPPTLSDLLFSSSLSFSLLSLLSDPLLSFQTIRSRCCHSSHNTRLDQREVRGSFQPLYYCNISCRYAAAVACSDKGISVLTVDWLHACWLKQQRLPPDSFEFPFLSGQVCLEFIVVCCLFSCGCEIAGSQCDWISLVGECFCHFVLEAPAH